MTRRTRLRRDFFARDAQTVARQLVGMILVRRLDAGRTLRARIVETEAYVGSHDLACHASRGRTARTQVMFGPAAHAYVYLIYGIHDMLNVVTGPVGDAQAVLLRAAQPLNFSADLRGPGKLARHMHITRALNGEDLATGRLLWFEDPALPAPTLAISPRIGVDYAGPWKAALLRFYDKHSPHVSASPPRRPR